MFSWIVDSLPLVVFGAASYFILAGKSINANAEKFTVKLSSRAAGNSLSVAEISRKTFRISYWLDMVLLALLLLPFTFLWSSILQQRNVLTSETWEEFWFALLFLMMFIALLWCEARGFSLKKMYFVSRHYYGIDCDDH